jgi:hypothetical protein
MMWYSYDLCVQNKRPMTRGVGLKHLFCWIVRIGVFILDMVFNWTYIFGQIM